ncbi:hypothetical protein GQ53DRAFT_814703 [Thozetella sp. PMI_491]|nr:hypothetical protein GQ53DRAFT_814703 [Thozetella sp. PMI_491]
MAPKGLAKALLVYGLLLATLAKPSPFLIKDTGGFSALDVPLQARAGGGHGDPHGGDHGGPSGQQGAGSPGSTSHQGNQGAQSGDHQQQGGNPQQGGGHGEPNLPNSPNPPSNPGVAHQELDAAIQKNWAKGNDLMARISHAVDNHATSKDSAPYWSEMEKDYHTVLTDMNTDHFSDSFVSEISEAFYQHAGINIHESTNIKKIQIWGTKQETKDLDTVFEMYTGKNPDGSGWAISDRAFRSSDDPTIGKSIDKMYNNMPKDQRQLMSDHFVNQFMATQPNTKLIKLAPRYVSNAEAVEMSEKYTNFYRESAPSIPVDTKAYGDIFNGFAGTPIGSMLMYAKLDYPDAFLFRDIQPDNFRVFYTKDTLDLEGVPVNEIYWVLTMGPKSA